MPTDLTDDPTTFPGPIEAPAGGEARSDTALETSLQQLGNRTANSNARLNAIAASSAVGYTPALPAGVRLGSVPLLATSIAAMLSIPLTNRFDGMLCQVQDDALFCFDAASTTTPFDPAFILLPTDLGGDVGAAGRWFRSNFGAVSQPYGFPQCDSAGRVPAASVRSGLVAYQSAAYANANPATNSTPTLLPGTTPVTLTGLAPGDIIEARYSVAISVVSTIGFGAFAQLQVSGPGTALTAMTNSTSGTSPIATTGVGGTANGCAVATFTVPPGGAGDWQVGIYAEVTAGSGTASFDYPSLIAQAIRP